MGNPVSRITFVLVSCVVFVYRAIIGELESRTEKSSLNSLMVCRG